MSCAMPLFQQLCNLPWNQFNHFQMGRLVEFLRLKKMQSQQFSNVGGSEAFSMNLTQVLVRYWALVLSLIEFLRRPFLHPPSDLSNTRYPALTVPAKHKSSAFFALLPLIIQTFAEAEPVPRVFTLSSWLRACGSFSPLTHRAEHRAV